MTQVGFYRTQLNAVRRTCRCENPVQSFKLNLITQRGTGTVRFDQCDISRYDFCGGKRRIDRFYLSFYAGGRQTPADARRRYLPHLL